jgi:carboxyl-terminal processing protease
LIRSPRAQQQGRLAVLLFLTWLLPFSLSRAASSPDARADDLRGRAQLCEQRGDWLEACRCYDELLRKDRSKGEVRDAYQRCLRQLHLQRRHRDPVYREALTRLLPSQALDLYDQVLKIVSAAYVDRDRADLTLLFRQGIQELRLALNEAAFLRDHLAGSAPEAVRAFQARLDTWPERRIYNRAEAKEEVRAVGQAAQEAGLDLGALFFVAVPLEFACGACNALDEYTLFLTPSHYSDVQAALRGKLLGVGIDLMVMDGKLTIARVTPRSPAEEAGLRVQDRLLRVDGQAIDHLQPEQVAERLRGEAGTLLELEVLTPGHTAPRVLKLMRRPFVVPSVELRVLSEMSEQEVIGYLRINGFQETTLQEVKDALAQLQGVERIQALVLDLRDNPGGLFKSAVQVSELFLGSGVIVIGESRVREYNKPFKADIANPFLLPLAVLVNGETASSAEILAGALKEQGRARLFGQTTYGKGTIQCIIPVPNTPAGIRLSVARLLSPTRRPYADRGIVPNEPIPTDGEASLLAAKLYLQSLLRMVAR